MVTKSNVVLPVGVYAKPVVRDSFDLPSRDSDILCEEPSLAQQQFKDDADINVLLERFKVTGVVPQGVRIPTYGDFTGVTDYQSAANAMLKAEQSFMALDAKVRAQFENSPQVFLEFCSDPKNIDKLREMGLAVPAEPEAQPMKVVVVDPAKPAS